jgi:hypothetical protein
MNNSTKKCRKISKYFWVCLILFLILSFILLILYLHNKSNYTHTKTNTEWFTNSQRTDGFGAIFQNIIFDILWAHHQGYNYSFSKITSFDHNYENEINFTETLNSFMNMGLAFPDNSFDKKTIPFTHSYAFVENNIDSMFSSEIYKKIKMAFFADKSRPFDLSNTHVAVHVRRPNLRDNRIQGSNTPNSYYICIIKRLREDYKAKNIIFHIYSQGDSENFKDFLSYDTYLHLNESITDTFLGLTTSDILITSASSFSYTAALLTSGTVYYKSFWHPPLNSWIIGDTVV